MIVKCDNCTISFNKKPSKIKVSKHNFCSPKCSQEFQSLDLTGKTFDQLKVLELDTTAKTGDRKFKCRCSCNRIISVHSCNLTNGHSTKCRKCQNRKYVGDVSGSYFNKLKQNAIKRNIEFNITQVYIWNKFLQQNRKCAYTGLELIWRNGSGELGTASVDRKDNSIGYVKENIQIIHKDINRMKFNHTEKYFLELCGLVYLENKNKS